MNAKTALITGGTSPIGQAIGLCLAKNGYDIAIHYHQQAEKAAIIVREIMEAGGRAAAFQADLSIPGAAENLYTAVCAYGYPTVLINSAALFQRDTMHTLDKHTLERHLHINAHAAINLMERLAKQGTQGLIINMLDSNTPNAMYASYSMSKAMLWEATQLAAKTYAPTIRVNAIALGYVGEPIPDKRYSHNWLHYTITAKDVADTVLFLIKNKAITAEKITLSGGKRFSGA